MEEISKPNTLIGHRGKDQKSLLDSIVRFCIAIHLFTQLRIMSIIFHLLANEDLAFRD